MFFFFFFKMCFLIWHYVIFYLPINRSGTNFAHNWAYVVCGNINKCIFINKYINVFFIRFYCIFVTFAQFWFCVGHHL